jgi:hypothetical protein
MCPSKILRAASQIGSVKIIPFYQHGIKAGDRALFIIPALSKSLGKSAITRREGNLCWQAVLQLANPTSRCAIAKRVTRIHQQGHIHPIRSKKLCYCGGIIGSF